jgi:hypothetical protein
MFAILSKSLRGHSTCITAVHNDIDKMQDEQRDTLKIINLYLYFFPCCFFADRQEYKLFKVKTKHIVIFEINEN